jgi:hypothetical protein
MAKPAHRLVTYEHYVERRAEHPEGSVVERRLVRARWERPEPAPPASRQVLETAGPLLRAVAIALAPALGRLALRALAPRLTMVLPLSARARPLPPRRPAALPPPGPRDPDAPR